MNAPVGSTGRAREALDSRRGTLVVFAIAIAVMATVAWLDWRQFGRVLETEAWVARTHRVQAELNRLLVLAVDIETGARGFVVTGDPVFLEPFESGVPEIGQLQRQLAEELVNDDEQRANLETLQSLITANILRTNELLELRRSAGFEPARQHIASGRGKAMMDRIRTELATMRDRQSELLATRSATASRQARFTRRLVMTGTALSVALLIAVVALLLRENRLRLEAKEAIAHLNADLTARATELAAVNRELESFSYSVSHDLRAPLRHIEGYAALLTKATAGDLPEEAERYLRTLVASSVEMGLLIDGLLALSRIGRSQLESRPTDIESLADSVVRGLEREVGDREIAWTIGALPTVSGDPTLLKQVLANLVGNAVKYSAPRETAEIEIGSGEDEDGMALLYVRDNGVGFDMRYADKLFGAFQRLHRADEFDGTGIGLATVRRIVTRHGGRVWAESQPDRGATFYFTLPRAVVAR